MRKSILGAAHDNPRDLIGRAVAEAAAYKGGDTLSLRRAAETGWLAASAVADVAAKRLGLKPPGGQQKRFEVLERLETQAKLQRGSLTSPFGSARGYLHGDCFHEDKCPVPIVKSTLLAVQDMTLVAEAALNRLRGRRG